jgi:hypothetical protein
VTHRASDPSQSAGQLLRKLGRALSRPGLPRSSVFTGATGVFAYSSDPEDPSRLVREAKDGTRTVGVWRGGRFRPIRTGR